MSCRPTWNLNNVSFLEFHKIISDSCVSEWRHVSGWRFVTQFPWDWWKHCLVRMTYSFYLCTLLIDRSRSFCKRRFTTFCNFGFYENAESCAMFNEIFVMTELNFLFWEACKKYLIINEFLTGFANQITSWYLAKHEMTRKCIYCNWQLCTGFTQFSMKLNLLLIKLWDTTTVKLM